MPGNKRTRPSAAAPTATAENDAAGPGPGSTASGITALHRNRMFDWKPSAVVAIAPCPGAPLFAVGYESGRLELWDMLQLVCIQTVTGPCLELTSLAWARDTVSNTWRTFAAFLDGTLAEVVWRQGAVSHSTDSYGGVVWALAASPVATVKPGFAHLLAAACDDGSVRLFGCEGGEPGLVSERVLARFAGRLLCCTWHAGGTALAVAGTTGNIHVLDAVTGIERQRITAAAATTRPVTVWRLLSLPDGTLVSSDSDGATQMWDTRFGTLLSRFTQHKADVLALAAMEDGSTVFAAGVDSQVAMFTRVPGGSSGQPDSWAYTHYKRPHTHDVRALAMLGLGSDRSPVLLSGGVDAQLMAYPAQTFLQEHPHRLSKSPQRPLCQAATGAGPEAGPGPSRLLVAQQDTLDVWQLARAARRGTAGPQGPVGGSGEGPEEGEALELVSSPRHLARVRVKGARVTAACLSPSGTFLACTTPSGSRVYSLEPGPSGGQTLAVSRLRLAAAAEEPGVAVAATDSHLVLSGQDGSLLAVELPSGMVVASREAPEKDGPALARGGGAAAAAGDFDAQAWRRFCTAASQLVVPADGSVVAAVGPQGISLFRLPGLEPHGRVLRADSAFTAAAFSHDGRLLAATTSACQLLVWDVAAAGVGSCQPLPWSLENAEAITAAVSRLPGTPTCISFAPGASTSAQGAEQAEAKAGAHRLIVNGPGGLVHFDLSRPVDGAGAEGKAGRRARSKAKPPPPEERPPEGRGSNGRVIRTLHPVVWVGHVGPSELCLLEKPWEEVLASLPPPLFTHRYGH